MWVKYNPNPAGRNVGDCAVRAVSAALGLDWETAYSMIVINAFLMNDMPSSDSVLGSVLRANGFRRYVVPNSCPDCYTAEDFAREHPKGVYVLAFGGHVATLRDQKLMDSWDSSKEIVIYYWTKEDVENGNL